MDKKKILLVDDEMDLVKLVSSRLTNSGYDVVTAYDGREALDKVKTEKPQLIILDLMLPRIDGHKVCAMLKADARYNKIPVLIFTAKAETEDMELSKEAGADAYITKPFEPDALLKKIDELLKEKG
ncbi:MAG: response regulator [Candidatus Omnitrophota bacterium]|nr:MAG: response regulator [Candidatus Omnitrophota bacterium]